MRLNREQFLVAALALSAGISGCKLKAALEDSPQAAPEQPAKGAAPATPQGPGEQGALERPDTVERGSVGKSPTTTGRSSSLVGSPVAAPAKEAGFVAPTKEVGATSPTKEALTSPTKEALPAPTKEALPAPTKEAVPPPTKEKY